MTIEATSEETLGNESPWSRRRKAKPTRDRRPRQPVQPMAPLHFSVFVTLATVLGLALWFLVYSFYLSGIQEAHDQRVDYSHLRQDLALATAPIGGAIKPGTPVALMSVPQLHLHNVVAVDGTSSTQLESGPGHLPNTPLPGQAGTSWFFGRSSTFGAPFGSLHKLRPGSLLIFTTGQGVFTYTVADLRIPGDPVPPALANGQSRVTLVTSQTHGISHFWTPGQVLYVDANLTHGTVQPSPSGRPTSVVAADAPFHGDTSGLVRLVLWLQLLVIAIAATAWAWWRWTKLQTWVVAAPTILAILWGTTSAVVPLLPNLS